MHSRIVTLTIITPLAKCNSVISLFKLTLYKAHLSHTSIIAGVELVAKEHLVFSDTESHLYHFSVDGSTVKDGIKIPPEVSVLYTILDTLTLVSYLEVLSPYNHDNG